MINYSKILSKAANQNKAKKETITKILKFYYV